MTLDQTAQLRDKRYNATVVRLRKAHPELLLMRVRSDFPRPVHKPGQYVSLGLGYWEPRYPGCQTEELKPGDETRLVRRTYSISCPVLGDDGDLLKVEQTDWLEFYIVLVPRSDSGRPPALTPRLFLLEEGDRINIGDKIAGHYTLDPVKPGDSVVFLSTGTGEAPHNYMLWELLNRGHTGKIVSACCVRYRRDLAYTSTHETLMKRYPNYSYIPLATREENVARKVYVQDLIRTGMLEQALGRQLDPDHTHVFLCGNPQMIGVPTKDQTTGERAYPKPAGVIELLEQRGFKCDNATTKFKGTIHFEEYW